MAPWPLRCPKILPATKTQPTAMDHTDVTPGPEQGSVKCLFVDDQPPLRQIVARRLGGRVEVFLAADGRAALEVLAEHPDIDVVITDVNMPDMDGLALTRECRRIDPELGVIIVSGQSSYENVVQALRLGA